MTCPDMDRLIEFGLGTTDHAGLQAHVESCVDCQADLRTIRLLAGIEGPERDISEEMISRIVSGLPEADAPVRVEWTRIIQHLVTWALGSLTAIASLLVTGTIGAGRPSEALLLAVGFGALCLFVSLLGIEGPTPPHGDHRQPNPT